MFIKIFFSSLLGLIIAPAPHRYAQARGSIKVSRQTDAHGGNLQPLCFSNGVISRPNNETSPVESSSNGALDTSVPDPRVHMHPVTVPSVHIQSVQMHPVTIQSVPIQSAPIQFIPRESVAQGHVAVHVVPLVDSRTLPTNHLPSYHETLQQPVMPRDATYHATYPHAQYQQYVSNAFPSHVHSVGMGAVHNMPAQYFPPQHMPPHAHPVGTIVTHHMPAQYVPAHGQSVLTGGANNMPAQYVTAYAHPVRTRAANNRSTEDVPLSAADVTPQKKSRKARVSQRRQGQSNASNASISTTDPSVNDRSGSAALHPSRSARESDASGRYGIPPSVLSPSDSLCSLHSDSY